jgi:hypothetical protein
MLIRPGRIAGGVKLFASRAFAEFSRAVASDPAFPPQALELLWEASGGDACGRALLRRTRRNDLRILVTKAYRVEGCALTEWVVAIRHTTVAT